MTNTKRKLALSVISNCIVILTFVSCGKTTSPPAESVQPGSTISSDAPIEAGGLHYFSTTSQRGDGCSAGSGYYRILPRQDASNNIYYIDYESNTQSILCSQPECPHDNEACTSWFQYNGGGNYPLYINDMLLIIHAGNTDPDVIATYGASALANIEIMDKSGSNQRTLCKFSSSDIIKDGFAYNNTVIYFTKESFENASNEDGLPTRTLCQLNIGNGQVQELLQLNVSESLTGAFDDKIVLSCSEGAENFLNDAADITSSVRIYTIGESEPVEVFSHSYASLCKSKGSKYFLYDSTASSLSVIDLKNEKTPSIIREGILTQGQTPANSHPGGVFDKYLALYAEFLNDDMSITEAYYLVDTISGELIQIDLGFTLDEITGFNKPVEVVDEYNDQFLVLSSVDMQNVQIALAEEVFELDYPRFNYSLISKEAYLSSQGTYTPIESS